MTLTKSKSANAEFDLTPLRLETFLPYQLNHLSELVSGALSQIYAREHDITVPEWRIIATLGQYGTMMARDIANHSRMNKTMVSRAATSLADRHLICRSSNPDDKREAFLTLSPSGKVMYASIIPKAKDFNAQLSSALDENERLQFEELLNKITSKAVDISSGDV
ncbi:MAG: MarR family winged helix-turn-helix transcriptional regulator [Hyphomicrobiales bacterium]